jgi:hypothetical protein
MKQNITYRGKVFRVDVPYQIRTGICTCCGKKGWTARHHWKYEFSVKEVRKNPLLALKNTTELCYPTCHDVANAMNLIKKTDVKIILKLLELNLSVCPNDN